MTDSRSQPAFPPREPNRSRAATGRLRAWRVAQVALAAALLWAQPARADSRADARRHFRNGMTAVGEGRYEEGIAELKAAYAIKPHPSVLYNIAKAFQDEGRVADAIDLYQQYLSFDPPDAEQVGARVRQLQASVGPKPDATPTPTPTPLPETPRPATDEATAKKLEHLDDLLGRLDAAVSRAEALQKGGAAPAPTPSETPTESSTKIPATPATPETAEELAVSKGDAYDEVVVTASRYAQSSLTAPASTTTITSEEILLSGATSLPELLRRVPGIDVMQLGVGSADVSIRGFNQRVANKLLVLIDGRSVYEDFLGLTIWDEFPIELAEIDRIEIIRGPASALYGANAFVGLVNIITRKPGTGPTLVAQAGGGTGKVGEGYYVASQRFGRFAYRASAGYTQADKYTVDFAANRTDFVPQVSDPNLALRSVRGNAVVSVDITRSVEARFAAGINQLDTEVYPLGVLRNYFLQGIHVYNQADVTAGPFKIQAFWNHLQANAGPEYWPPGEPSLAAEVVTNVLDFNAQLDQAFHLGGEHHLDVGVGYRLKTAQWAYLSTSPVENHFSAFVQDEYRPIRILSITGSLRADRDPLLDSGKPGFAISPRGAVVVTPWDGHAFHFSASSAFREPTLVESYTYLAVPVPGQPSVAALTEGNPNLHPEQIFALELGYRAELNAVQLDVALYREQVSNLIVLGPLSPLPANQSYDQRTHEFLVGSSQFINDTPVYTALGGELGVKAAPVDQLALRASFAGESISADSIGSDQCVPCGSVPAVKLYGGASYRSPFHIDFNADAAWVSSTRWIERDPAAGTGIAYATYPLGAYAVVNARAAYRFLDDHLEVGVVGTNLASPHQEHPFGNQIDSRVMGTLGGSL